MNKLVTLALLAGASPAWGQQAPASAPAAPPQAQAADDPEAEETEVVVQGQRPPGSVPGDIPPTQQLSPADIRSYGVNSVGELLNELGPQTRSGRGGAPVVLLNGRRISGFQEIRDIPTEAILRVDILPEEVALKYGYRADQRVVNFVLRRRFRGVTVEAADRIPTEGGRNAVEGSADLLEIRGDQRVNMHVNATSSSALTEAERDVQNRTADGTDRDPFRTLLPQTRTVGANATYARPLLGATASLNGEVQVTDTNALLGRDASLDQALAQESRAVTAHLGSTANGEMGRWRWNLTGAYDRSDTETFTGIAVGSPANQAYAISDTAAANLLVNGPAFSLPAGDVSTSVRVGGSTSDFRSRSVRFGAAQAGEVSRDLANAQANIDLPIARRGRNVLSAIGDLSLNANAAVDRLSDFGTLFTYGYGANWSPLEGVRLIASQQVDEDAPSAQQLGNPIITTPNARVFDYLRGETVAVTTITGGNPNLRSNERHATRLGLTVRPWSDTELTLQADYNRVTVDDPIAGFPAATAAIAAAFPQRFVRDADGRLLQLDARPINFARSERSELRWGFNYSRPLKSKLQKQIEAFRAGKGPNPFQGLQPPSSIFGGQAFGGPPRQGGQNGAPGPGAGAGEGGRGRGGFGGGRFGGGGRGGQAGGRLQFALYHTWHFTDRVTVADGGPVLDLLNGDATGNAGGQPRHELEGQAGYTNNGLGARLSVNFQSATDVRGGTAAAPQDLRFGSLTTANLRLFADLGGRLDWVRAHPWFRGMRVAVAVDNLFNQRQRVRDEAGTTPLNFQPDLLNPLGRSVRVSVRKLLF